MRTLIPIENDVEKTITGFLRRLLEEEVVEALLLPLCTPGGHVRPGLVTNPARLEAAAPLAPVMSVNAATLAGNLSRRKPRPRLGAVLRPCEARALVELVKLQQASLEDLLLISVDCPGTYPLSHEQEENGQTAPVQPLDALYESPGTADVPLRAACRICAEPTYDAADVVLELFGERPAVALSLSLPDELGERLGLEPAGDNGKREVMVKEVREARGAAREETLAAMEARLEGEEGLAGVLDACIRCHNCMTVCPICYCQTCVFKSELFAHEPQQYVSWARQKGALRLPADTSLFHLTRLNHMALSCVGCGMCTEACPAALPVGELFQAIGRRVQALFDYTPGREVEETIPLLTFSENEWTAFGESQTHLSVGVVNDERR